MPYLDRYIDRFAAKHEAQLFCEEKSVESALADYFAAIANCFTSKDTPAGCFMINNCTTLSPDSGDIANTLKSRHAMQERTLQQFLCQRQARGEIPTHCDVTHLAEFLNCIIRDVDQRTRRCIAGKTNADCRNDFAFMARTGEISRKKAPQPERMRGQIAEYSLVYTLLFKISCPLLSSGICVPGSRSMRILPC